MMPHVVSEGDEAGPRQEVPVTAVKVAATKRSRGTSASEGRLTTAATAEATENTSATTGGAGGSTINNTGTVATSSSTGPGTVDPSSGSLRSSQHSRQGSVDGVMQRCGLCSIISSLLRRAMCVGSRRGSGESYYQELAETNFRVSQVH
uniref:Uncharacterized protein n=1 Tax=Anopheles atroparvus TaxID=41427 RepID=A0A182J9I4_ANOAO